MPVDWSSGFWGVVAAMLGACIGSFLNVVIYRVPLGMSVNEPKRSFCPHCKHNIRPWENIPIFSWLFLRGKCSACKAPIAFRYVFVEILTCVLFVAVWMLIRWEKFPPQVVPFLWLLMAIFVAVTFIDLEHMIIPVVLTCIASALGVGAAAVWPILPSLGSGVAATWQQGVMASLIGWSVGFFGLWGVVWLGKLAFGRLKFASEEPAPWEIIEPEGDDPEIPLIFQIDEERIDWWDLFYRKTDHILLEADTLKVDGEEVPGGSIVIQETKVILPGGVEREIADLKSLSGTTRQAVLPREAMGMGDVHLLGSIGAFFGWPAVLFSLFAASLYAILAAVARSIGFGKPLPFGPFLAAGALTWLFGGWHLWSRYLEFLGW